MKKKKYCECPWVHCPKCNTLHFLINEKTNEIICGTCGTKLDTGKPKGETVNAE